MKKTDLLTVDELLHRTLLLNALEKNDKESFDALHSPDYELVKEREVSIDMEEQ